MKIENMLVSDIIPYMNNAKEHPKHQIEQIVNSIREFGFNDPIAIDEHNVIIEGHGRLEALKLMVLILWIVFAYHILLKNRSALILLLIINLQ